MDKKPKKPGRPRKDPDPAARVKAFRTRQQATGTRMDYLHIEALHRHHRTTMPYQPLPQTHQIVREGAEDFRIVLAHYHQEK